MSYLVSLLERDGVRFKDKSGSEWQTHCFLPTHGGPDKNPSMSVDVTKGVYYCHKCGLGGNAYRYLTEVKNMSPNAAAEQLKADGEWREGIDRRTVGKERKEDSPEPVQAKLAEEIPASNRGLKTRTYYDYRDAKGRLVMRVVRYSGMVDGKPQKSFLQLTPASKGAGWYLCKANNRARLPENVGLDYLPIYRHEETKRVGDIWFVEGEKCADAINDTPSPFKTQPIGVTIAGGSSTNVKDHDFTPIKGRNVIIIADADNAGRKFAARVGSHLKISYGCNVRYVMPKGGDGYDIADVLTGGWESVMDWIKKSDRFSHPLPEEVKKDLKETMPKVAEVLADGEQESYGENYANRATVLDNNEYFRIIGYASGGIEIAFYWKENNTVLFFKPRDMSSVTAMVQLAPSDFWRSVTKTKVLHRTDCLEIQDVICRIAEKKDMIRTVDQIGRGAALHEDQIYFNLGDRFLSDPGRDRVFRTFHGLEDAPNKLVFEPGDAIVMADNYSKAEEYAKDLYDAVLGYRFQSQDDARRMLGWMVASMIGGALQHRPHLWLSAPAKSGKTYLINSVLQPFFGNMFFYYIDPTYAGIAQHVRSDSLGVVIDEFEPEEHRENQTREILAMLRGASGGNAKRTRGTSEGRAQQSAPRFSAMLSSVNKPALSEADESRLVNCFLSKKPVHNWDQVKQNIARATTRTRMEVIRTAIIMETPSILDVVDVFVGELEKNEDLDSRTVLIHAALTAGAYWLSGDDRLTFQDSSVLEDRSYDMLKMILSSVVSDRLRSEDLLGRYVIQAYQGDPNSPHTRGIMGFLHRYGIKWWEDRNNNKERVLLVAKNMPEMQQLIRRSPVHNLRVASVVNSLKQIDGVYEPVSVNGGQVQPTFGSIRKEAVAIPRDVLLKAGLDVDKHYDPKDYKPDSDDDLDEADL